MIFFKKPFVLKTLTRRVISIVQSVVAALLLVAVLPPIVHAENNVITIGYQKYGSLILLKNKGLLDAKLAPLGYSVKWAEFAAGPQLLEALNAGAIDFGNTGEAPPIFSQAAGSDLVYVGFEPPAPLGEAILVPKDSPIKTLADLKGKNIAFNKGSNVHYLLVKALEKSGVQYSDITTSFLPPADGRAAFERGSVDAWAIWDPFLASAQQATGARVLTDGTGIVSNYQFYFASRKFYKKAPEVVKIVLEGVEQIGEWAKADPVAAATELSPLSGIPAPILEVALRRQVFGVKSPTPEVIAQQQQVADTFFALGLIPKKISISDATP